jgi:cell division protein FtsN
MSVQHDGSPRRLWADRPVLVKILTAVLVMVAMTAVVTAVAIGSLRTLRADAAEMYSGNVTPLQQLTEIQRSYQGDRARVIQYGIADAETRATLADELTERQGDLAAQIEEYRANAVSQDDVDTMVAALDDYYAAAEDTLFPMADAGDTEEFGTYFNDTVRPLTTAVMDAMQVETTSQGDQAAALAKETDALGARSVWITVLVALVGALAASALVLLDPPPWVWALVIAGVVVGATATSGSRWYVLPTFTTLLVFVMLLARDPQDAGERFWERVSETALGVGVAALVALVVLPAVLRRRAAAGSDRLRQGRQ